jgi:cell division protein FtsA
MTYEHNRKQFEKEYRKVEVPDGLKRLPEEEVLADMDDTVSQEKVKQRRGLSNFWGKFKDGIIDLFKEEEDKHL